MAKYLIITKNVVFFSLFISLLTCNLLSPAIQAQSLTNDYKTDTDFDDFPIVTKQKPTSFSTKNQTKSIKSVPKLIKSVSNLPKNQTKLIKSSPGSAKNQTKLIKPASNSPKNQTKLIKSPPNSIKNQTKLSKLASESAHLAKNKTKLTKPTNKTQTPIKPQLNSTKPSSDLPKLSPPKTKTTKTELKSKTPDKPLPRKQIHQNWLDEADENEDLVAEFRDLPSRFQQTLLPDLEKISVTSKVYLTKYNKQITMGFKPYVGTKYAPTIASFVSFAFIIIPMILVSLLFNRIKAYFSLQKILIFIQVYICIYFYILCLSSLVTGLEPLRFFYAASRSTYICVQVLQTLGYVLYLLMLLMYLVLVFSSETGPGSKMLGLAQTFVGFAVGLHYYVTVFHRVVLRQPPKTNWKVHGIYATCFLVICVLAGADRRKKAYLEEGGEEGKKN